MKYILTIWVGMHPFPLDNKITTYDTVEQCVTAGAVISDDLSNPNETKFTCLLEEKSVTKIAYNRCYGGFSLSEDASKLYAHYTGIDINKDGFHDGRGLSRTDPVLIQVIEELGSKANGRCAQLAIQDLNPGTKYRIEEYDGMESVITQSQYEWETA